MIFAIVFGIIGIYCIFSGVKTILTGSLSQSEEQRLRDFSQKGAKTYKLAYAVSYIIGGLCVIGYSVLNFLEAQNILPETMTYRLIILGVVIVDAIILFAIRSKCKKMTDDE